MASEANTIGWYDAQAARLGEDYGRVDPAVTLAWVPPLLADGQALILDVGAGTGRDAAWLASLGHKVVAVEPSSGMQAQAKRHHPHDLVEWREDSLPGLAKIGRAGLSFDAILLNAVWQHVPPPDRRRAFRKLVGLLRAGGILLLTLRDGPSEPERAMHPAPLAEVEALARDHGMTLVLAAPAADSLGREAVRWTNVALRLPDDGTGALPLLRHVILNDAKTSTYKLGLLRALARIADGSAGLARDADDDHVALPFGLVALVWLRLYLPLAAADLPQMPGNVRGVEGLGFAGEGFRFILGGGVPRLDLRLGTRFTGPAAQAVHAALREAAGTIAKMPAHYMTYPNGGPILPVRTSRPLRPGESLVVDAAYLLSFGEMSVPRNLWSALGRFAAWVEPTLIAEWSRLMNQYARSQGRRLDEGRVAAAMTWSEPERDVALPRQIALRRMSAGEPVLCVWTQRKLDADRLDIDHCMPWSAWPCSDLWNLLPADRRTNQHSKRDRLPTEDLLIKARERMFQWWHVAYTGPDAAALQEQFRQEALASLPGLMSSGAVTLDEVHAAARLQRLRLRRDQQIPEWAGTS